MPCQAGLLAVLPAVRDPDAELAARAYQRAVHQLRNQPEDDCLSYLELASRIAHATRLTDRIAVSAPHRRWSAPWTHWPSEHPHRILDSQLGPINGVICADLSDGTPVAVSIGQDAKLRIWDVVTAEPRGTYTVGWAPLIALRAARLRDRRTVIVLLSADGRLHTWDMSTAELRTAHVAPRWQRLTRPRDANLTLRCLGTPDGRQFAVTGGRGIRTSIWDLSEGRLDDGYPAALRRVAIVPGRAAPAAIEFTELTDGRTVIVASTGGTGRQLCDLQTGQELPYEHRRIRFAWLRFLYDSIIRGSHLNYYASRSGPPLVAVRFFRKTATVWDLTARRPLGTRPRGKAARIRLANGRAVTVPLPPSERRFSRSFLPGRRRIAVEPVAPAEGPDSLILLGSPARQAEPPECEPREPLSVLFEVTGRFLRVRFRDDLEEPDRGTISLTLAGHTAGVTGYDWVRQPDGHVIVITGSRDGTVRRWDISSIRPGPGEGHEQPRVGLHRIVSVPLEDGTPVGLTVADGVDVALWNLRTGELIGELAGRAAAPCAIGVAHPSEHAPVAVTVDVDQTMRIWTLPDGRQAVVFPDDRIRWPGGVACTNLPDGTCVAVTSGHGRKSVVWDLATGRIRHVLAGHRGWPACVTCAEGRGLWPLALTGGHDNRVNVWGLHHGQRRHRLRIVSPVTFLVRPSAGLANSVHALPLDSGRLLVLVATADGTVRALEPRGFPFGARRKGAVPGNAVATAKLSTRPGNAVATAKLSTRWPVVVTATYNGVIRVWTPESLTRRGHDRVPLCEINIEVPVSDISFIEDDTFIIATPNGLTAIRFTARLLETHISGSPEAGHLEKIAAYTAS